MQPNNIDNLYSNLLSIFRSDSSPSSSAAKASKLLKETQGKVSDRQYLCENALQVAKKGLAENSKQFKRLQEIETRINRTFASLSKESKYDALKVVSIAEDQFEIGRARSGGILKTPKQVTIENEGPEKQSRILIDPVTKRVVRDRKTGKIKKMTDAERIPLLNLLAATSQQLKKEYDEFTALEWAEHNTSELMNRLLPDYFQVLRKQITYHVEAGIPKEEFLNEIRTEVSDKNLMHIINYIANDAYNRGPEEVENYFELLETQLSNRHGKLLFDGVKVIYNKFPPFTNRNDLWAWSNDKAYVRELLERLFEAEVSKKFNAETIQRITRAALDHLNKVVKQSIDLKEMPDEDNPPILAYPTEALIYAENLIREWTINPFRGKA